ncbi:MAG: CapA family protein [Synechococcales cyanobacterium C42_A2020_086]|jgi:poly-gamma-glutamate synthesis protein (capsule biosynthesis protein)|nr:CapA family protein [Synechococcales cyanobacterium C42_A2020_086]
MKHETHENHSKQGNHDARLTRARQGDANAIAQLINQALSTRGIQVRAIRKGDCLYVLLEGMLVPERQTYSRVVYAVTLCLGAPGIRVLRVYGRQRGDHVPAWTQAFRIMAAAEVQPTATPPVRHSPVQKPRRSEGPWLDTKRALPVAAAICAAVGLGLVIRDVVPGAEESTTPSEETTPVDTATAAFPSPVAAPPSPPVPTASPTTDVAVTIKAVGDLIPGSNYSGRSGNSLPTEAGEALAAEGQMLFGNIRPFFEGADILFANFESTLTDYPYSAKDTSQNMTFSFRTPPVYAQMLKEMGFDVLSVANNHSLDFGDQGFADTIAHIEQAGMKAVGQKGQIVYTTANGVPVAFIGFSYLDDHNSMHDLAAASALVQEAKQQAKIVVVSVHAGAEGSDETRTHDRTEYFFGENRGNLVQFSRTMIDQGADLILGHGPHVPRAMELYQGKLIAYSLGNFMGYQTLATDGPLGYSLILTVQMNAEGDFVGGRIIPVALDANGIPKLDDFFQSVVLIRNRTQTDFPQTPLRIDDMGYLLKTDG